MNSLKGVKAISIVVNETKKTAKKLAIKKTFRRVNFKANRSSKVSSFRITNRIYEAIFWLFAFYFLSLPFKNKIKYLNITAQL